MEIDLIPLLAVRSISSWKLPWVYREVAAMELTMIKDASRDFFHLDPRQKIIVFKDELSSSLEVVPQVAHTIASQPPLFTIQAIIIY